MRLLNTADAAMAAGVQEGTIRQWGKRGKLTRHGDDRSARWDIDELLSAARPLPRRKPGGCYCGSERHSPLCAFVWHAITSDTPTTSSGGQDA